MMAGQLRGARVRWRHGSLIKRPPTDRLISGRFGWRLFGLVGFVCSVGVRLRLLANEHEAHNKVGPADSRASNKRQTSCPSKSQLASAVRLTDSRRADWLMNEPDGSAKKSPLGSILMRRRERIPREPKPKIEPEKSR